MNLSEIQLTEFLEFKKDGNYIMHLSLMPQGDNTIIEKEALNLCKVKVHGNEYLFGGISETVYDRLVDIYDIRYNR
jgi:hypothetical protein